MSGPIPIDGSQAGSRAPAGRSAGSHGRQGICHFFGQPGGCRNGARCEFAHVGQPGPAIVSSSHRSVGGSWRTPIGSLGQTPAHLAGTPPTALMGDLARDTRPRDDATYRNYRRTLTKITHRNLLASCPGASGRTVVGRFGRNVYGDTVFCVMMKPSEYVTPPTTWDADTVTTLLDDAYDVIAEMRTGAHADVLAPPGEQVTSRRGDAEKKPAKPPSLEAFGLFCPCPTLWPFDWTHPRERDSAVGVADSTTTAATATSGSSDGTASANARHSGPAASPMSTDPQSGASPVSGAPLPSDGDASPSAASATTPVTPVGDAGSSAAASAAPTCSDRAPASPPPSKARPRYPAVLLSAGAPDRREQHARRVEELVRRAMRAGDRALRAAATTGARPTSAPTVDVSLPDFAAVGALRAQMSAADTGDDDDDAATLALDDDTPAPPPRSLPVPRPWFDSLESELFRISSGHLMSHDTRWGPRRQYPHCVSALARHSSFVLGDDADRPQLLLQSLHSLPREARRAYHSLVWPGLLEAIGRIHNLGSNLLTASREAAAARTPGGVPEAPVEGTPSKWVDAARGKSATDGASAPDAAKAPSPHDKDASLERLDYIFHMSHDSWATAFGFHVIMALDARAYSLVEEGGGLEPLRAADAASGDLFDG